jgi:hypothetical protein
MTGECRDQPSASFQVRLRGHLGAAALRAFPDLNAATQEGDTLLRGVRDQAALHGVLARVEELGLELVEVRHADDNPGAS